MLGAAVGSWVLYTVIWVCGRVAGKLPSRRGPTGVGWQPAGHEPAVCPGG